MKKIVVELTQNERKRGKSSNASIIIVVHLIQLALSKIVLQLLIAGQTKPVERGFSRTSKLLNRDVILIRVSWTRLTCLNTNPDPRLRYRGHRKQQRKTDKNCDKSTIRHIMSLDLSTPQLNFMKRSDKMTGISRTSVDMTKMPSNLAKMSQFASEGTNEPQTWSPRQFLKKTTPKTSYHCGQRQWS